jgi:NADH-quinone oxidoreductase subunit N
LAYSAINHVGFLLLAILCFKSSSIFSLFFYIFVYIIISLNIFSVILCLRKYSNNLKIKKINEYVNLFKSYPILGINFSLILFSIGGIPPLAGFYSKFYVFISALKANLFFISIFIAIFSVISCLYYIRLIKLMFFKKFEY